MTRVKCPQCGLANPEGAQTCSRCGGTLPQVRMKSGSERQAPVNPAQGRGPQSFRRGQVIAGRYTIIDIVGRGGMGCIYRVHDQTLSEQVALKTLLPQFLTDKLVVERFFNEARIARQLSHPNIVRVHDIGVSENIIYISMEYLKGRSLRAMIDQLPPGQRLPVTTTVQIMLQLCAALEYAHQYTIHRDIKPENVMIMEDGSVKLMDFGISKLMTANKLTATSVVMGTPHYMSPEQIKDSSAVDARADVYSIGVMLYEILTGNLPTGVPKPASQIMMDVPPSLDPIVSKCVEPDPNDRYQNIAELKGAFRSVLSLIEDGSTFQEKGGVVKQPKTSSGPALTKLVGVALALAVLAIAAYGLKALETRRAKQLADSPVLTPTVTPTTSANGDTGKQHLDRLMKAVGAAKRAAAAVEETEETKPILERGATLLKAAEDEQTHDLAIAERRANLAAQCFLSLLPTRPQDVLFVPPSENDEDGFYIDEKPVTPLQFASFASKVQGGWKPRPMSGASDEPISGLTYYDAQAYAAFDDGRLPTESEWQRASEEFPEALATGMYEWTSTTVSPNADHHAPTFGDQFALCRASKNASNEIEHDPSASIGFGGGPETANDYTGPVTLRCIHDIPTDAQSIERLLAPA